MKEVKLKIFKFGELSEAAKKVAIEWYRDLAVCDDNLQMWREQAKCDLAEHGFLDAVICHSLYSQGSGVSFSSEVELVKFLPERVTRNPKLLQLIKENLTVATEMNRGNYAYPSRSDVKISDDLGLRLLPRIWDFIDTLQEEIADRYMELCKKLHVEAEKEDMYYSSDEYIIKTIEANEYDFTINGRRFYFDYLLEENHQN